MLIRLYFNDPQGRLWNNISSVVTGLKGLYAFDVEIVKKTSFGLFQRVSMPKFPSIEIDGTVVFEGCDITREQLEAAIKERLW